MWIILGAAVAPALLLLYYVYSKDFTPEPRRLVFKGFFYGALAVCVSLVFTTPMTLAGVLPENPSTLGEALKLAFLGAGIPEESATGTANAALTHYLSKHGVIPATGDFSFLQGETMGRPSVVATRISADGTIYVGGAATIVAKGEINY